MKNFLSTANKKRIPALIVLGLLWVGMFSPAAYAEPVLVSLLPEHAFVPPGFDDNDNAQLTITGTYLNSCYRSAQAQAEVDPVAKKVRIKDRAYFYENAWCLMVLVPYVQTIQLGVMAAGNYTVVAVDDSGNEKELSQMAVAKATTESPDEFLYANVIDANVSTSPNSQGLRELTLTGSLSSDCLMLRETKVMYRTANVIEVLPIAETKPNILCQQMPRPFNLMVGLKDTWKGITLVHIRSLSGQSINKIVEF